MRATTKTVLYVQVKHAAKTVQTPIAVFPNDKAACDYAVSFHRIRTNADSAAIVAAWPGHPVAEDGTPLPTGKFARVELPYALEATSDTADLFG